jgi:sortase A
MYDAQQVQDKVTKDWRILLGGSLVAVALLIISATFLPLIGQEIGYYSQGDTLPKVEGAQERNSQAGNVSPEEVLVPVDEEFGIVIPKIRANSRIHADIDWQNAAVYQKALQTGVAQASGTSTPDMPGNMFLFSHSGVDFYEAARYNAEFYLLGKLTAGDEIDVFYKGQKYLYTVRETKMVAPSEVNYIQKQGEAKTVTLMTCWPPGTTYKRLIVIAEQTL